MLYKEQECSMTLKIKVKPGIVEKAEQVYKANHPFCKKVDFDELFEQLITLAAIKLKLIFASDLGISEEVYDNLQRTAFESVEENQSNTEIQKNDTLDDIALGQNLLN